MKNLLLFLVLSNACCLFAKAGDGDYAVSKIPPSLLINANAVKRSCDQRFEVLSLKKAIYSYKVAYTILNENGDRFADCGEYYDKFHTIGFINGTLYNAMGKKIKSVKKADIEDRSGTSGGSLADDHRYKHHNFYYRSYPYTVEYEVEIRYDYTMFYPTWLPQESWNMSVQSASMEVSLPEGLPFRYKPFNVKNEVNITRGKSATLYTWTLKELPALQKEHYTPSWYELTPFVWMAPAQFAIEDYEGNMSSWEDFGKFVSALKAGKDVLPDNIKTTVRQLTAGESDPHKKIAALYDFMQKNTRYISIQLGLGGWQPYNAGYVASNRYGDCKALSNYMYALLKEAGIKSHYTLVKAGEGRQFFMTDFPSSQFNHAILCVPLNTDTVWLECTSQTLPSGYLSGFTSDRPVLLVDENGGKLVRTPKYGLADNLQLRHLTGILNAEGMLSMDVVTSYRALQEDDVHSLIRNSSKEKVLEHLKTWIDLPSYDITGFNYKEDYTGLPVITETLQIKADNYAQVSGKRIFISYNALSRSDRKLMATESRKYDIDLNYEYTDIDSVTISVPSGYQPESLPKDLTIESPFGKYSARVVFADNRIIYYRKMEQFSGRFPAKDYNDMVKFYDQIYKADRNKVVLVK